jgi:Uncharacterized conserved protein (DUF2190)
MTTSVQLGTVDTLVDTFHNFGASDIAAGLGVLSDSANPPAGDNAGGIVLPTVSGSVVGTLGVTCERIPAGRSGRVRVLGISVMTASGSIAYGANVQISTTTAELGYAKTCASGTPQLGIALDVATDGQLVRVAHALANNA